MLGSHVLMEQTHHKLSTNQQPQTTAAFDEVTAMENLHDIRYSCLPSQQAVDSACEDEGLNVFVETCCIFQLLQECKPIAVCRRQQLGVCW